jgi:hypothetical protein
MKLMLPLVFTLALLAGCTNSEDQAFKRAHMTDTVVGWEDFLRRYPDGDETNAARRRLVELHEDHEWQRAELADSVDSYQAYLQGYPQGRFSGEALVRIANLNLRAIPDHEPTPEELRAMNLAQLSGKAVEAEATPQSNTVAAAASSGPAPPSAPASAPTSTPALAPPSATKGPTALIRRSPPQIARLVPANPVAPQAAVKSKPAPLPVPNPVPKPATKPATKPVPAPAPMAQPVVKPAAPPAPAPVAVAVGLGWAVQLGAFGKGEAAALQHWQRLQRLVPAAVNGLGPDVAGPTEGKDFHRLRVVGLSRERARDLCVAVRGAGQGCVVTAP